MERLKKTGESPRYLKISLASALTIGLKRGRFYRYARSHCLNLLLTYHEGCFANCAYCGLARERQGQYEEKSFIRVDWPIYPLPEIIERTNLSPAIKRICVSMVTNHRAVKDIIEVSREIKRRTSLPLSLLISPTIVGEADLVNFKLAGADRIGVAVDGATPEVFNRHRGAKVKGPHRWEKYWQIIREAQKIFGASQVGVHLIVGLGETEKQMLSLIQQIKDQGSQTHLFSFYPEEKSALSNHPPPKLEKYRRIQLGRFLIEENLARVDQFSFNQNEEVAGFGIEREKLEEVISKGIAFMTSGCPGEEGGMVCNRPYANSSPGPQLRNYPFLPDEEDITQIKKDLNLLLKG